MDRDGTPPFAPLRGTVVHASALGVAVDRDGPLAGVLIGGESGAGKSELALAAIETCPFRRTALIADDGVLIAPARDGALYAACPEPARIGGLIEIRGVGLCPVRRAETARLSLIVRLGRPARLPEPETACLPGAGGAALPVLTLDPQQLSAPHKLRYGLRIAIAGGKAGAPART